MIIVILLIIMILLKTITVLGFRTSSLSSLSSRLLLSRSSLLSSSLLLNRKYNKFKKIKSNINDNITGTKNINDDNNDDNDDSIITTRVPKKFVPVPFEYHQVLDIVIDDITNLGLGVGRY